MSRYTSVLKFEVELLKLAVAYSPNFVVNSGTGWVILKI
jgi:hypothetical protein